MPEFDNTNRGCLFNARADKQTDQHPDYRGFVNVDGVEYWLSGWINTSRKGEQYLSLRINPKEQKAKAVDARGAESGHVVPFNDTIPFAPEWR